MGLVERPLGQRRAADEFAVRAMIGTLAGWKPASNCRASATSVPVVDMAGRRHHHAVGRIVTLAIIGDRPPAS